MKMFLITPTGETGPYTPAQLNRMFAQRQITGEQLCRREDAQQTQRLDEVFRHMRPAPANYVRPQSKPELSTPVKVCGGIFGVVGFISAQALVLSQGISGLNRTLTVALVCGGSAALGYGLGKLIERLGKRAK